MKDAEKKKLEERLCKKLALLTHQELREIGINGQQAVKIKAGQIVRFYAKTLARLAALVLKKNVA